MTRILMSADTVGGVWPYALQLASLLAGRGVQVVLATMGPKPSPAQQTEAAAVPGLDLRTSTYALEWMPDPWDDVALSGAWLLDLEADVEPDVVHLNGFTHGSLPFSAPALVVAHSDVASWWAAVRRTPLPPAWDAYVQRVQDGLRMAAAVVAPSRAMKASVVQWYGVPDDVVVIPNARCVDRWQKATREPFVLSAGRVWDEAKNIGAVDCAAAALPWPVRVAGSTTAPGEERAELRHAEPLGLLPPRRMAEVMARASIYALPARYEPFGLSVLEAALCGCALVLGDIDSLRENWTGAARFVDPDDVEALRQVLHELMDDAPAREALAAAAARRAALFSPERHRDMYYDLYVALLEGRAAHMRSAAVGDWVNR